jgi:hypothetical protein
MAILAVQAALASRPHLIPIGISLGAFFQYFGSSVAQSIGLAVLQNQLIHGLENDAGLDEAQVNTLLLAGFAGVRKPTREQFPDKFLAVLAAYDKAITNVFVSPFFPTRLTDPFPNQIHPRQRQTQLTLEPTVRSRCCYYSGILPGHGNQMAEYQGEEKVLECSCG